ncbi:MAG TPA: hypothetical protein VGG22_17025 [Candidatus Baltobacteraceae bacterium]
MTTLRAGPLGEDVVVLRSGVRWLAEEGRNCKPGDLLAYCNVAVAPPSAQDVMPFRDEWRDLQVAFLASASGRLRKADVSHGGFLDRHPHHNRWQADFSIGDLELRPGEKPIEATSEFMRLLFLAGRRVTQLADTSAGLLSGWYDRARMWRGDHTGPFTTVLSLGICEQTGIFRGERDAFLELALLISPSTHVVWTSDDSLVPSVRVLLEQLERTSEQQREIEADAAASLAAASPSPTGDDWIVAGGALAALVRSPLEESYSLLTRSGVVPTGPPDVIVLSLNSELSLAFRHRRLGYTLTMHAFRMAELSPAIEAWIKSDFDVVTRSVADVTRDYYALIDAVRERHPARFVVLNSFSSSIGDAIFNYAAFDLPMSDIVATLRSKELNLMLYDLARDRDVTIVDADELVAMLGAQHHLPDGVHQGGFLQSQLREQIARVVG